MKNIRIIHPQFGELLNDTYEDATQYKLFLSMVHSCIELKQDLSFFNGRDFYVHIPVEILRKCIILGTVNQMSLAEYAVQKSKMEF